MGRTTRNTLSTIADTDNGSGNEKLHENSVKLISLLKSFMLTLKSETMIATVVQKEAILIMKHMKKMNGAIHKNTLDNFLAIEIDLFDMSSDYEKMIEKLKATYAKFSISDMKDIEQNNLDLKLIDSEGTGLVDSKGNVVAESSKSILEFSIIKQKKVDFISTSVLQAIVKIENFGDGFESQKQNIDDEVNCGVILEKIKKLKGFLKKDNTAEAEVALSEIVFDIQNKKLNNIKGSIKKLIRLADDFKTIRTTSKTSLTLLQADFAGITGKELDFDFDIDGNLGKVVVRPMEGMIMKSEETLLEETRSQFIQSIKSKNSLSVLKTALDKIKSGTSGSSTLTMKFDQFSTILEEIILIIDQDVLNDRLQSLVVRILKISKTTFATTLSTAEKDFVSEVVTTIEKSIIKTKKVYEVVKQSLKKVTGKDVDESKF